ncbi:MAG: serine hydrolase [Sedimentisphaerales bacterium]|nr:serine hydrolase [Sedimentisphaerales bacterium]
MNKLKISNLLIIIIFVSVTAGVSFGANERKIVWPKLNWEQIEPEDAGMETSMLLRARDYALTGDGSGFITRHGRLVLQWGDQNHLYDLKSSTKAIGVTALGLALKDGKIKSIDDRAKQYHRQFGIPPESNNESGRLEKITIFHLATQTAGFDKKGGYTELMFEPGTKWSYSDGGTNWLAECITSAYGQDLYELMFERIFSPIGTKKSDLTWRNNAYRPKEIDGINRREFGSGISAKVDAMARIGYLYLRGGRWQDEQIIPGWFVDMARTVPRSVRGLEVVRKEAYFNASDHYGLLWWNNSDGTMANVPTDTYWSWGLYDSLIVVIPSLDIVASRAGKSLNKEQNSSYKSIEPFIEPIALSVKQKDDMATAPYRPSPVIKNVEWAPIETIIRRAQGSDNWPITWADDDNQYTAYGDGWGFEPKTKKKLSLGLAKIAGRPPDFKGINIRTETGERTGQGAKGAKASGMLMVDGVLYMLVRNTSNSQIAWSVDYGKSWRWSDWKFSTSFGAPTFLNFGRNYSGARDNFIYIYSHDSDNAYEPSDRMVMARVPKDRILQREAYEFFQSLDEHSKAVWTKDINEMRAVFINSGSCYRSSVSYNAGLKRYLWCQILPFSKDNRGPRFQGGFGIYDAPEPWGPWTTVYYNRQWDVGPGETSCLPTKWSSADGKTCYLLFSGDDCFSVRKVTFQTRD